MHTRHVEYRDGFVYATLQQKEGEEIAVFEFGEKGKNQERNHRAFRKNMEVWKNPDGTKFENLRRNYFGGNLTKSGSTDGKNFKILSEEYIKVKDKPSDSPTAPRIAFKFLHDKRRKTIQIIVQIQGKEFFIS